MILHIYTVIDYWFFKTWRHFGIILTLQSTNSMWTQIFSPHVVSFFIYLYDFCLKVYFVCWVLLPPIYYHFCLQEISFSIPFFSIYMCPGKWQPTPVFLPGEPHRWRSLVGYSPWGRKESDTTEWLHFPLYGGR